jgi:hypothetical protein
MLSAIIASAEAKKYTRKAGCLSAGKETYAAGVLGGRCGVLLTVAVRGGVTSYFSMSISFNTPRTIS